MLRTFVTNVRGVPHRDDVRLLRSWGRRVREARKQAGMTQKLLGDDSGVDRTTVTRIELGRQRPSDATKIALSNSLNVDANELFPLPGFGPR